MCLINGSVKVMQLITKRPAQGSEKKKAIVKRIEKVFQKAHDEKKGPRKL